MNGRWRLAATAAKPRDALLIEIEYEPEILAAATQHDDRLGSPRAPRTVGNAVNDDMPGRAGLEARVLSNQRCEGAGNQRESESNGRLIGLRK